MIRMTRRPRVGAKFFLALFALTVCAVLPVPAGLAAEPCCSIVAIDSSTGVVTLRDNKTGKTERVTIKDSARLAKLVVGQQTDRRLGQRYCSVETFEPCLDQERSHNCQPCPDAP
jgi:hypothetical protein